MLGYLEARYGLVRACGLSKPQHLLREHFALQHVQHMELHGLVTLQLMGV